MSNTDDFKIIDYTQNKLISTQTSEFQEPIDDNNELNNYKIFMKQELQNIHCKINSVRNFVDYINKNVYKDMCKNNNNYKSNLKSIIHLQEDNREILNKISKLDNRFNGYMFNNNRKNINIEELVIHNQKGIKFIIVYIIIACICICILH